MTIVQAWRFRLAVIGAVLAIAGTLAVVAVYLNASLAESGHGILGGGGDYYLVVFGVPVAVAGLNALVWRWRLPRLEKHPSNRRIVHVVVTTLILAVLSILVVSVVYGVLIVSAFMSSCGGDC